MKADETLARRRRHVAPSVRLAYDQPLKIVRGAGAYLFDDEGRRYLDMVNNVCHVGHCHPRVVAAASRQMQLLNTNTRYLHDNLALYAERLAATLPDPLEVCFFVCSGSEANDLALRLARTASGRSDVCVVDGAYHGTTSALIDLSPYKYKGPGGGGRSPHVLEAPMPDDYRGPYRRDDPEAGVKYGDRVGALVSAREGLAAVFCESMLGCGGEIEPPAGYLATAYRHVRAAGGICVADEVQVGFGRVGSSFWAFERQGVVPDVVTLGKPIGNGHPLAAAVTTREIAARFDDGMEYFNTFGGNPVSCAVGLAVLDVIDEEGLQAHADRMGARLATGLRTLQQRHALIGDVRGTGLFLGVELVRDRETLEPARVEAHRLVERMKERGILLAIDGPHENVLKLKPPLVISGADVDRFLEELDLLLSRPADPAVGLP